MGTSWLVTAPELLRKLLANVTRSQIGTSPPFRRSSDHRGCQLTVQRGESGRPEPVRVADDQGECAEHLGPLAENACLQFDRGPYRREGVTVESLANSLEERRRGRDAEVAAPIWVVLNKVRRSVVPGDPRIELSAALERFAGRQPAALLPYDPEPLDAALVVGKTLGEARPNSVLRQGTVELAAALAGAPHAKHRRRHG